jgi:endonuclease YncB( thermonuclease family)
VARTATALVLAVFAIGAAPPVDVRTLVGQTFPARVVSVVDGDTIDVTSARTGTLRVRLEGIDTPERGEPFSRHATNCLRRN